MALTIAFVRRRGDRDRVYVTRGDASSIFWDFPTYDDRLPHDLCHLVVEEGFGIGGGFWGMVDRGVEVRLVDNQATLMLGGSPLAEQPGVDLSDLMRAEAAVAALGPAGPAAEEHGVRCRRVRRRRRWIPSGGGWTIWADGGAPWATARPSRSPTPVAAPPGSATPVEPSKPPGSGQAGVGHGRRSHQVGGPGRDGPR